MPPTIESFLSEKLALNAPSTGGPPYNVPSEIPLMPTDALLRGRDGRTYLLPDAAAVINASVLPVAVDCEHGSASPYTSASGRAVGRVTSHAPTRRHRMGPDGMDG